MTDPTPLRAPDAPRSDGQLPPRRAWRKPAPRPRDLPKYDPLLPRFIETAPARPRFTKQDGSPMREPKALRRAREEARFHRFQANPWQAYVDDPAYFWQLVGTLLLVAFIAFFLWYCVKHPPVRFGILPPLHAFGGT